MSDEAGIIFDLKVVKNVGNVIPQLQYLNTLGRRHGDNVSVIYTCKCYELIDQYGVGKRMLDEVCRKTGLQLLLLFICDSVYKGKCEVEVGCYPMDVFAR